VALILYKLIQYCARQNVNILHVLRNNHRTRLLRFLGRLHCLLERLRCLFL
jgi:hypothetical protein